MKILVTSSTGLTGKTVVKALAKQGVHVRAMIHSDRRKEEMLALGASETVVAPIESEKDMREAMSGMDAVFYICPTAHPEEGKIGKMAIRVAEEIGIKKFIYQSVHNSIEPELPHHRQKLMVEQVILESKLNYIILRPAAFMQNVLPSIKMDRNTIAFTQRFYSDIKSTNLINLIDVNDYAEIATRVSTGYEYDFGQYDLCGPQNLSIDDMISAISQVTEKEVIMRYIPDEVFIEMSRNNGLPESKINTLLLMFQSYNEHGFKGNPLTCQSILSRNPTDFYTFLKNNKKSYNQ